MTHQSFKPLSSYCINVTTFTFKWLNVSFDIETKFDTKAPHSRASDLSLSYNLPVQDFLERS